MNSAATSAHADGDDMKMMDENSDAAITNLMEQIMSTTSAQDKLLPVQLEKLNSICGSDISDCKTVASHRKLLEHLRNLFLQTPTPEAITSLLRFFSLWAQVISRQQVWSFVNEISQKTSILKEIALLFEVTTKVYPWSLRVQLHRAMWMIAKW
jgi:hypothetical protein